MSMMARVVSKSSSSVSDSVRVTEVGSPGTTAQVSESVPSTEPSWESVSQVVMV